MMKSRLTLKMLAASLLLTSCAQTSPRPQTFTVQALEGVRHGYDQAEAHYELGRYYHGQRRYAQAIAAYRKALTIEPGRRDAEVGLGVAYAETGDLTRARERMERIVALHPQSSDAHNNLGFVLHLSGDYPAATRAYKQALRLEGGHQKARQNLVVAMEKLGLAEQIARSELPPVSTRERQAAESPAETRWVEVSYGVYALQRNAAVPVESELGVTLPGLPAATGRNRIADGSLEVANGNGVRGMGAAVARYLSDKGLRPSRVTNQKPFGERVTRIEYRPGSAAEAAAIGTLLPHAVEQRVSKNLRADIRVRVVLGRDIAGSVAQRWLRERELKLAGSPATTPFPPI